MSKAGQSILRGARQSSAYARGERDGFVAHVPDDVDVAAIRSRLGLSQAEFAARFGFKLDALQNWEQGRRYPDAAARAFLSVIDREPDAVLRALASDQGRRPPRTSRTFEEFRREARTNWCRAKLDKSRPPRHRNPGRRARFRHDVTTKASRRNRQLADEV